MFRVKKTTKYCCFLLHTCRPSPMPNLRRHAGHPPVSLCWCRLNASSQSSCSFPCPASRAFSPSRQSLAPPHCPGLEGRRSSATRRYSSCGCSSDWCTTRMGLCRCSGGRCGRPLHVCILGRTYRSTNRRCYRRAGCRQPVCSNTRRCPHRPCRLAWACSRDGRSSSSWWECLCSSGRTCGFGNPHTRWYLKYKNWNMSDTVMHKTV